MRRSTTLLATRSFSRGSSLLTSTRTSFAASSLFSRRAYGTNDSHVPQPTAADARIAPEKLRTYTREEVAKHAYEDDCWVIVNGRVYNVSTWADLHPGGRAVLHAHAGGDATDLWVEVGHTARARALMERYCIGKVEEPKRYTGYEHHVIDIDDSGYTLPAGADKEEILEDVSSYRYSTR